MLDAPLKIPQSLKFLQQSIFLKNTLRQGIQDTPKRRGNLIPFLCFNKAHLIEGLRIGGNSGQSVFLDILARFLREFQQFTPGLAVLAGRFSGRQRQGYVLRRPSRERGCPGFGPATPLFWVL